MLIACSFLHFLCSYFLRIFCTLLYDMKYSYLIQIICKQIYLTNRWDPETGTSVQDKTWPQSKGNGGIFLRTSELEHNHQMWFSVYTKGTHLFGKRFSLSAGDSKTYRQSSQPPCVLKVEKYEKPRWLCYKLIRIRKVI